MEDFMIDFLNRFNDFLILFFQYMKYIFAFILIMLGIFTLLSLRKIYFSMKLIYKDVNIDFLRKTRLILGTVYIILGSGILFNYLLYFLILILSPLPDQLLQNFIIDTINSYIKDLNYQEYILNLFDKCLSNAFALASFIALLNLFMSFWFFLNNRGVKTPRRTLEWLIISVASGIIFGFSSCLPLLL